MLCIGLFRLHDDMPLDSLRRYVITNPPDELKIIASDFVYVLEPYDPGLNYVPNN